MRPCECGCGLPTGRPRRKSAGRPEWNRFVTGHNLSQGRGPANSNWRGDAAESSAVHAWLNNNHQRAGICEWCQAVGPTDYANLSGRYVRDRREYAELCRRCHMAYDAATRRRERGRFTFARA